MNVNYDFVGRFAIAIAAGIGICAGRDAIEPKVPFAWVTGPTRF